MLNILEDGKLYVDGGGYRLEVTYEADEHTGSIGHLVKTGNKVTKKKVVGYPSTIINGINMYVRHHGDNMIDADEKTLDEFVKNINDLWDKIEKSTNIERRCYEPIT